MDQMPPNMAAMAQGPEQPMPPDQGQSAPPPGPPGTEMAGDGELTDEQLGQEMEAAEADMADLLFGNTAMSDKIIGMADEREKIGSVAKAVVQVVTEMDKRGDYPEEILAGLTAWTADAVMELVNEDPSVNMKFSEKEANQVVMTATELLLDAYGVSQQDRAALGQGMAPEELTELDSLYKGTLNA